MISVILEYVVGAFVTFAAVCVVAVFAFEACYEFSYQRKRKGRRK